MFELRCGEHLAASSSFQTGSHVSIGPNLDDSPLSTVEDGGHVRRGYTEDELVELCRHAGLMAERTTYCSGFLSQNLAYVLRILSSVLPGWSRRDSAFKVVTVV